MDTLSNIEAIIRDLLVFVVAMSALLVVFLVIVSRMPDDNPLKRIMVALSYRIGATAAAGMLAIPATPIPGLDAVVDIGADRPPLVLVHVLSRSHQRPKSAVDAGASGGNAPAPPNRT